MFETIEAEITPGMAVGDVVALAQRTEYVGFDRLGISDAVSYTHLTLPTS